MREGPNAGRQARLKAAARYERRLKGGACTPMLGWLRGCATGQPEGTAQRFRVAYVPALGAVPWKARPWYTRQSRHYSSEKYSLKKSLVVRPTRPSFDDFVQ